jgi:hypothetical protein
MCFWIDRFANLLPAVVKPRPGLVDRGSRRFPVRAITVTKLVP